MKRQVFGPTFPSEGEMSDYEVAVWAHNRASTADEYSHARKLMIRAIRVERARAVSVAAAAAFVAAEQVAAASCGSRCERLNAAAAAQEAAAAARAVRLWALSW